MEYYFIFAIENTEILPLETMWVNLERIMLSEISQTEKDILMEGRSDSYIERQKASPHGDDYS